MSATIAGPDGKPRCRWCGAAPEFLAYHDTEWGFPVDEGERKSQWVMTVNARWRICFPFRKGDAYDVDLVDYHKGRPCLPSHIPAVF